YRVLFKIEYYYLFATPHWLTRVDRLSRGFEPEKIIAGREKIEGYRIWITTHLADFIRQTLLNPDAAYVEFFDPRVVQRMVIRHLAGTNNYLNEINKVLTAELAHACLIQNSSARQNQYQPSDDSSPVMRRHALI